MKIRVGLFGFGKTGSLVAQEIIKDDMFELRWVVRKSLANVGHYASHLLGFQRDEGELFSLMNINIDTFFALNKVDVIIDFAAVSAVDYYDKAVDEGTRIVSAVSRYDEEHLQKLYKLGNRTAVLYSPNITLGINFLIEASKVLQGIAPNADIEIIEEHFRDKKEVSGTALRIAEDLGLDKQKHVNSIRVGGIVGKHEVVFGLPYQTIRITHEAISRSAFGQGALYAAKWLMGKEKGIYSMEEAVSLNFAKGKK
ncbi:dihydrodipicolinate reductase C-terminal domain-containing protein [Dehalobacter sp. 14DCB1]|uniref:4-hydroxy-tetrahydrodipicolinate reductase n=1 Tax=Dehalobacter sp. 14DCB1 TaxID=2070227 RepID=UPI00104EA881|nr:dihydrodipicolinate reductase C-terminal domain-containing protein [Dehalobacter sp. 14DCB1]TCX48914.1 dihydrodipicolinate reductase [Dehalobacter sp. 14DCB1]